MRKTEFLAVGEGWGYSDTLVAYMKKKKRTFFISGFLREGALISASAVPDRRESNQILFCCRLVGVGVRA